MADAARQVCYVMVPVALVCDPRLNSTAKRLYEYFLVLASTKEIIDDSISSLASALSISESTIDKTIRELVRFGLVSRKRRLAQSAITVVTPIDVAYPTQESA